MELLEKLCTINGVSGDEADVKAYIEEQIRPYCEEILTDNLGSLVAFRKGRKRAPKKLMFAAHMDETGYYVTRIDESGLICFQSIGVSVNVTPGQRVRIKSTAADKPSYIDGVIGLPPIHMTPRDKERDVPPYKKLRIDIGAKNKDDAASRVCIGDSVYFDGEFGKLGQLVKAKALDDRVGCATMIKLIQQEPEYDCWFAFNVQEEVGCRGSAATAFALRPEVAVILEGTTAADIGAVEGGEKVCIAGQGVALSFADRSTTYDPRVLRAVTKIADKNNVLWQYKTFVSGGNDAGRIQRTASGCYVCALSVPVRYLHSRISAASVKDIDSMLDMSRAIINNYEDLCKDLEQE